MEMEAMPKSTYAEAQALGLKLGQFRHACLGAYIVEPWAPIYAKQWADETTPISPVTEFALQWQDWMTTTWCENEFGYEPGTPLLTESETSPHIDVVRYVILPRGGGWNGGQWEEYTPPVE